MFAILKNKEVVPIASLNEWVKNYEHESMFRDVVRDIEISTVFLGIDHGISGKHLWFETMIFGGKHDGFQKRYETYQEAEEGHKKATLMVRG